MRVAYLRRNVLPVVNTRFLERFVILLTDYGLSSPAMLYVSFCTVEQSVLQCRKGFFVVYYGPFRAVKKAFSWLETGFSEIRMSIKQVSDNFRTL